MRRVLLRVGVLPACSMLSLAVRRQAWGRLRGEAMSQCGRFTSAA